MDIRIDGERFSARARVNVMVSEELLTQHNLTEKEYRRIVDILHREPTMTELGILGSR